MYQAKRPFCSILTVLRNIVKNRQVVSSLTLIICYHFNFSWIVIDLSPFSKKNFIIVILCIVLPEIVQFQLQQFIVK